MNGIVKAGCESCSMSCKTFEVDRETLAGFELVSGAQMIPVTIHMPDMSSFGLIKRIKERQRLNHFSKLVSEFIVSLPTCGGPVDGDCRFKSGVEELDESLIEFAETMAPILPHLIRQVD